MRPVWDAAAARAADVAAQAAVTEAVLIERAATAVARHTAALMQRVYGSRIVVIAGKGHNGADALRAAELLRQRGAWVDVVVPVGEPADEHGRGPLRRLVASGARVLAPDTAGAALAAADVVLDGLLGVGARSDRALPWDVGDALDMCTAAVVAVDVPTGVDAATGAVRTGAVRADLTVTFGAIKSGLLLDPGREYAGQVVVEDIGLGGHGSSDVTVLDADDVEALVRLPQGEASKYTRGVVGVAAGGEEYVGAAVLAVHGALRAGAGMVRLHSAPVPADAARRAHPEVVAVPAAAWDAAAVVGDRRVDAWVVGPGLGTSDAAGYVVRAVLGRDLPVVVDADAITLVAADPGVLRRTAPTVVTPHAGEFRRLCPDLDVLADRVGAARVAAERLGCHVLLKGRTTVVAAPDGAVRLNVTGSSVLATAGTGDVLSGVLGTLLARGLGALDAASASAWVHGLAGRLAAGNPPAPIVASDVADRLPEALPIAARAGRRD